jgi:peptide chain release factor 3
MRVFKPGQDRRDRDDDEILAGLDNPAYAERFGMQYEQAESEIELLADAAPPFDTGRLPRRPADADVLRLGGQQLRRARGARRLVDLAPPPGDRAATQRIVHPDERSSAASVFKIQANMDPAHRDRIAFVRVASGHFERGMRLKVVRSGKELRPNTVVSFLSQRRELLDEAFAGDIIGIPNHGVLQLGDTLTEGERCSTPAAVLRPRDVPLGRGRRPAAHQAAARRA